MTARSDGPAHRAQRELLGAYALGHLDEAEAAGARAHLDGCPTCRAELAEIAPLARDLRGLDPARLSDVITPPADLGSRIRTAVADERVLVDARAVGAARRDVRRRRAVALLSVAAAAVLLAGGIGLGAGLERERGGPAAPAVPAMKVEQLALERTSDTAPSVESAGLIAHTWGVEVKLVATGFAQGELFRAAVRDTSGRLLPAGEFLGTGDRRLTCNLQAALLRPDTEAFVITDAAGTPVLTAAL